MKTVAAALLVALIAIPAADAGTVRKSPQGAATNRAVAWTKRVIVTPDGGFLIGNPAARAKLVEYGSLSCPYCQAIEHEMRAPLDTRIASGQVSFEFRPFAVHSADPILHALLRCAGPTQFRRFAGDFFDAQGKLTARYEAWAEANQTVDPGATAATRIAFARDWGFTAFAMSHGLGAKQAAACLSDTAALRAQTARENAADQRGVRGTPTFFLNGNLVEAARWSDIDQAITAVLAAG